MKKTILAAMPLLFAASAYGQPCTSPPTINFNNNTHHICPGEEAHVIATPIGTVGPVAYDWIPGTSNSNSIHVQPSASMWQYLEITDNCFTVIDSVYIDIEAIQLSAINTTDATNCPGQPASTPGSIQVIPDDPAFTYTLIGGGVMYGPTTVNTFINLAGGIIYFLNIENNYGCEIDTAISVGLGANGVLATWLPASLEQVTCFGDSDGAAAIANINGGILPPYDVTWTHTSGLYDQTIVNTNGGDDINTAMGGDWVVAVTDQEGCAWSNLFTIEEADELVLSFNINEPTCHAFTDGSITVIATGGNGGNEYDITNIAGTQLNLGFSPTANMLGTGWYFIDVIDDNGCEVVDSVYINQPGEIDPDISVVNPLCADGLTGSIIVDTVYNFNGSYLSINYFWNPNPSGTNGLGADSLMNVGAGDYTLTINDANGCSKVFDITVTSPPALFFDELGAEPISVIYGVVYASAGGGTPGYDYEWENLATGATSMNTTWGGLLAGDYQITVTDANGCTLIDTVTIGYLALDENTVTADFRIYPTLLKHEILYVENTSNDDALFFVYDLRGEIVFETILQTGKNELLPHIAGGSYFYQIHDKAGEYKARGKIVVAGN